MKKISTIVLLILFLNCYSSFDAVSQPPDPGNGYSGGDPDATPVPFDGGISLIVAAGLGYGIRKYKTTKTNKEK